MDIGQGYRWNIPIVTYGFDQSFIDYFGSNGVAAVESAIQILNDLPPASTINPNDYPLNTARMNYRADVDPTHLIDLKSMALCLLLEQMGLAQPTRNVYTLHDFWYVDGQTNYTVLMRNFDPVALISLPFVNGQVYDYILFINGVNFFFYEFEGYPFPSPPFVADIVETQVLNDGQGPTAVADFAPGGGPNDAGLYNYAGKFFTGLTRDDVGGLRYLLNPANIAMESLIPEVKGVGRNGDHFVNKALRPGVDKITFKELRHLPHSDRFVPAVYQYEDSYIINGTTNQQTLERVVKEPDILFAARYDGLNYISQTGTTNWVNNGLPGQDGPGVIQPPIVINFNAVGPSFAHFGTTYPDPQSSIPYFVSWGSFDTSTNPPIAYSANRANATSTAFNLWLLPVPPYQLDFLDPAGSTNGFTWTLTGPKQSIFALQTSTNLSDWVTLTTITNLGGNFTFVDQLYSSTPQRFYRTVPQ